MSESRSLNPVALLGLGRMGAALGMGLIGAGFPLTVWNRTASKMAPLEQAGACTADSVKDAIEGSEIVIVCLNTYDNVEEHLGNCEGLEDKVVVQLTSISFEDARRLQLWAEFRGVHLLSGIILAYPSFIGKPNTAFCLAGSSFAWEFAANVFEALAPASSYHGVELNTALIVARAAIFPLLMAQMGVAQSIHTAQHAGVDPAGLAALSSATADLIVAAVKMNFEAISHGKCGNPPEASLQTWAATLPRGISELKEKGQNTAMLEPIAEILDRAMRAGFGGEDLVAAYKVL